MSRQKKELLLAIEERDNHQLDKELLTNRLRHLEGEIEASKNSHNEKTREIRILEVRSGHKHSSWFRCFIYIVKNCLSGLHNE